MAKVEVHKLTDSNYFSLGSDVLDYVSISNVGTSNSTVSITYDDSSVSGTTSAGAGVIHFIKDVVIPSGVSLAFEEEEFLTFPFKNRVAVTTIAAPDTELSNKVFLIKKTGADVDILVKKGNKSQT